MAQATLQAAPTTHNTTQDEATSVTISVTVAAGTDTVLLAMVALEGNGAGGGGISSATFNGDALTKLDSVATATWSLAEAWYRVAPDVGTFNLVINWALDKAISAAYVCDNVNQSTPLRTAAKSAATTGTSVSNTVGSVAADDLCVDVLCIDGGNHAVEPGADQTEQYEINVQVTNYCQGSGSTQDGGAGGVMSHTWTGSAPYSHVATALVGAGTAPKALPPFRPRNTFSRRRGRFF
jgi:hypothetical protein